MKRTLIALLLLALPLAFGCGGGGMGSPDSGFDPTAYSFKAFTPATTPSLTDSDVRAVVQVDQGTFRRLYVGTANGLFQCDPTQATFVFTKVAGLPVGVSQAVNALLLTKAGALWIGTDGGLFTLDLANTAANPILVARLKDEKVTALAEQKAGHFWVGLATDTASTTALASSTNGIDFDFYGLEQGLTASTVVMIHATEEPSRVVVCGRGQASKGGVFRFKDTNTFEQIGPVGLTNGATFFKALGTAYYAGGPGSGLLCQTDRDGDWKTLIPDITPLAMDAALYGSSYRTWIGANDGLRLTFDLTTFKLFTKANGLASNTCSVVTQGSLGTFIGHAGTGGGLSRADLSAD